MSISCYTLCIYSLECYGYYPECMHVVHKQLPESYCLDVSSTAVYLLTIGCYALCMYALCTNKYLNLIAVNVHQLILSICIRTHFGDVTCKLNVSNASVLINHSHLPAMLPTLVYVYVCMCKNGFRISNKRELVSWNINLQHIRITP